MDKPRKYVPPHLRRQQGSSSDGQSSSSPTTPTTPITPTSAVGRWERDRPRSGGGASSSPRPSPATSAQSALLQAHGDSFVGPLKQLHKVVDVHRYSGATAKGLGNEKSEQQIGRKLVAWLDKTRPEKVLLQFGNVDLNISSVYRLETKGADTWDEKKFVEDVWTPYEAFLRTHIFSRFEKPLGQASTPGDSPAYIRHLYICQATLPIVGDGSLPESHAKYQYPRKDGGREFSAEEEKQYDLEHDLRMKRVEGLIELCGLEARRRMTADFNARLDEFAVRMAPSKGLRPQDITAEIHVVDLNKHIREAAGSDTVAETYVTADPTNLHIGWETTLPFWIEELSSAGLRKYDMPPQSELDEQWTEYAARKEGQMGLVKEKQKNSKDWS